MQTLEQSASQTHNLLLTTCIASRQIKFLAYHRLEQHRSLYSSCEHKYLSTIICANPTTLFLYSAFTQDCVLPMGQWPIFEDITRVLSWDYLIVVETKHKIAGLRWANNTLCNAFLLSLDLFDSPCTTTIEGGYLIATVPNNILIAIPDTVIHHFKSRPYPRSNVEILDHDIKWNQSARNHISEVIQIKLSHNAQQIKIFQDFLYYVYITPYQYVVYGFNISALFLQTREPLPIQQILRISNSTLHLHQNINDGHQNNDFAYPNAKLKSIIPLDRKQEFIICCDRHLILKNAKQVIRIDQFEAEYKIYSNQHMNPTLSKNLPHRSSQTSLPPNSMVLPIVVWAENELRLYDRNCNEEKVKVHPVQFSKSISELIMLCVADDEYLLCYTSLTETGCLYLKKFVMQWHRVINTSFGKIVDFHLGRNLLLLEDSGEKRTQAYELSPSLKIDIRPYVTHTKKMYLEKLLEEDFVKEDYISSIHSFFGQYLVVRTAKKCILLRESKQQIVVLNKETNTNDRLLNCIEALIEARPYLVLFYIDKIVLFDPNGESTKQTQYTTIADGSQQYCVLDKFAVRLGKELLFLNLLQAQRIVITCEEDIAEENCICSSLRIKKNTMKKKHMSAVKVNLLFEYIRVYSKRIVIYEINVLTKEAKVVLQCEDIGEGPPLLWMCVHEPLSNKQIRNTEPQNRFKSITCPQYSLNNIQTQESPWIKHACIEGEYLILMNSADSLLVYKYELSFLAERIYARVLVPLTVIKGLRGPWDNTDMGLGFKRICNYLFYKGNWLEHSSSSKAFFHLHSQQWTLLDNNKIRLLECNLTPNSVGQTRIDFSNLIREIDLSIQEQLMGVESGHQWYCFYSRSAFEVLNKQYQLQWKPPLENEMTQHSQSIITLKLFQHYVAMSYYDYFDAQFAEGVKFKFRLYNILTKTKIIQKAMQQPILYIKHLPPDRLLLATSSAIFINVLRQDKTLQLIRNVNLPCKRSFLSAMSYFRDGNAVNTKDYILMGNYYGGLAFWVGEWVDESKIIEQWHEPVKCAVRELQFFHYGIELKAVLVDDCANIIIINLKNNSFEKLCDIHLSSNINVIKVKSEGDKSYCYIGCSDGSIRILHAVKLPNTEISYLDWIDKIKETLPFIAGFNLRCCRELQQRYRTYKITSKGNVVDGALIQAFFMLTHTLFKHILTLSELTLKHIKANLY